MKFSRQEYCSGVPFPLPGDLPDPEIEPVSLASPALAADSLTSRANREALPRVYYMPAMGWALHESLDIRKSFSDMAHTGLCGTSF